MWFEPVTPSLRTLCSITQAIKPFIGGPRAANFLASTLHIIESYLVHKNGLWKYHNYCISTNQVMLSWLPSLTKMNQTSN